MATINTILARLVEYGEAKVSHGDRGQRVWLWVADRELGLERLPDHKSKGFLLNDSV
jgi:hypothetical protein